MVFQIKLDPGGSNFESGTDESLLDAALRQSLRDGALADAAEPATLTPDADARVRASVLTAFMVGRLQRFARSGFRRAPTEVLEPALARLL